MENLSKSNPNEMDYHKVQLSKILTLTTMKLTFIVGILMI